MKKLALALAAATMAVPAVAHPTNYRHTHQPRGHAYGYYDNGNAYDRYSTTPRHRYDYRQRYDYNRYQYWQGRDGRYYCRRGDGTVGLLIGGGVGALIGREIDRGAGTIIGGAVGAILGREISRGRVRCT